MFLNKRSLIFGTKISIQLNIQMAIVNFSHLLKDCVLAHVIHDIHVSHTGALLIYVLIWSILLSLTIVHFTIGDSDLIMYAIQTLLMLFNVLKFHLIIVSQNARIQKGATGLNTSWKIQAFSIYMVKLRYRK